jgi:hypothetical protein
MRGRARAVNFGWSRRPPPHPDRHPDPGPTRRPQPGSRLAAGHPQGPGLDPGENGATIPSRDAETAPQMQRCLETLLTMSRDITRLG